MRSALREVACKVRSELHGLQRVGDMADAVDCLEVIIFILLYWGSRASSELSKMQFRCCGLFGGKRIIVLSLLYSGLRKRMGGEDACDGQMNWH